MSIRYILEFEHTYLQLMKILNIEVTLAHEENWCSYNRVRIFHNAEATLTSFLNYRRDYLESDQQDDDIAFLITYCLEYMHDKIEI